jgi:hypothetical protein
MRKREHSSLFQQHLYLHDSTELLLRHESLLWVQLSANAIKLQWSSDETLQNMKIPICLVKSEKKKKKDAHCHGYRRSNKPRCPFVAMQEWHKQRNTHNFQQSRTKLTSLYWNIKQTWSSRNSESSYCGRLGYDTVHSCRCKPTIRRKNVFLSIHWLIQIRYQSLRVGGFRIKHEILGRFNLLLFFDTRQHL